MAQGKNTESTLTPEEKMAQVLVPDWEWPHILPYNWLWVRLEAVLTEIKNGTTIKQDKNAEGFSVTRIESLQNQTIDFNRLGTIVDSSAIKETDWYKRDDIALSHINSAEHVGKTALITQDMLPLVHGMNLLRLRFNEACLPIFFQYYSQSFQYKAEISERINMAVNQVSINQKQLGSLEFPLPPINEQQRIVDRIEYLFTKLDEAKEKALSVLDSFEIRKAAILHKAFSGELTAKWRTEQSCSAQWETRKLGAIVTTITDKYDPTKDTQTDLPYIGLEHIQKGTGIIGFGSVADVKSLKSVFRAGDILYGKLRPYLDKHGITTFDGVCSTDILVYRASTEYTAKYVNYLFSTKAFIEYAVKNSKGINLPRTSAAAISSFVVQVPTEKEQAEIVRILDSLFAKEQQAKEAAEAVLEKIDLLKKSILARAFRGELGTNDPAEESALELLKQVLQEDVPVVPKKRSKSIPKELQEKLGTELERKIVKLYFKQETDSLPAEELLSVSSKKFEVMDSLHNLEQRGILKKLPNGNYRLLE